MCAYYFVELFVSNQNPDPHVPLRAQSSPTFRHQLARHHHRHCTTQPNPTTSLFTPVYQLPRPPRYIPRAPNPYKYLRRNPTITVANMSFLFGGKPQLSSEQKIAQAEAEIDMVSDMYSRYVLTSSPRSIPQQSFLSPQPKVYNI